jgi:tetratricopeptide (TPR) repeat protein
MQLSTGLLIFATLFGAAALCQKSNGVVEKARALARSGRLQQAEQILRQAIESRQDAAALHGELGSLLYSSKRFEEAIDHLARAAQLDPKNPSYTIQLAGALIGAKRFSVAIDLLNAVRGDFNALAEYHHQTGMAYFGIHNFSAALKEFQQAVEIDPKLDVAHFFIGNSHAVTGELEAAVTQYKIALELNPNSVAYCFALGKVLGEMGPERVQESIRWLVKALTLKPDDVPAKFALALSSERAGNLRRASALLEDVTAQFPDELAAHIALVRVYTLLRAVEKRDREIAIVKKLQENKQQNSHANVQPAAPFSPKPSRE